MIFCAGTETASATSASLESSRSVRLRKMSTDLMKEAITFNQAH